MTYRDRLQLWVREAIGALGGEASVNDVAKEIWRAHEPELRDAGDHFYSWQYDIRWAAQRLREQGKIGLRKVGSRSIWLLKN